MLNDREVTVGRRVRFVGKEPELIGRSGAIVDWRGNAWGVIYATVDFDGYGQAACVPEVLATEGETE